MLVSMGYGSTKYLMIPMVNISIPILIHQEPVQKEIVMYNVIRNILSGLTWRGQCIRKFWCVWCYWYMWSGTHWRVLDDPGDVSLLLVSSPNWFLYYLIFTGRNDFLILWCSLCSKLDDGSASMMWRCHLISNINSITRDISHVNLNQAQPAFGKLSKCDKTAMMRWNG